MDTLKKIQITTDIHAPVERVWEHWTQPERICQWNSASEDWHCPEAENELRVGGRFRSRMEARDGSQGFDFGGTYTSVEENRGLDYVLGDGRNVRVRFEDLGEGRTRVLEEFEAESTHTEEMQRSGWQAILTNFKRHVESSNP